MSATLTGAPQLKARLKAVKDVPAPTMQRLGLATVAEAKRRVSVKTGVTRRTIRLASFSKRGAEVTVGGAGPYLEKGTRAHIIRPRRAKALRFPAKGVGTTRGGRVRSGELRRLGNSAYIFAKAVRHPGTKAKPFLLPAARAAIARLGLADIVVRRWNDAA